MVYGSKTSTVAAKDSEEGNIDVITRIQIMSVVIAHHLCIGYNLCFNEEQLNNFLEDNE